MKIKKNMSKKKYKVISCDPPWSFNDELKMEDVARGATSNYKTLSLQEIKDLKIKDIADPDGAILALWVPSSLLKEGIEVMESWGFQLKQNYIWVKTKKEPLVNFQSWLKKSILKTKQAIYDKIVYKTAIESIIDNSKKIDLNDTLAFGMGRLFRQTHEICLIGINSKKIYKSLKNKSQRSVSFFKNEKHSKKPEYLQDSLDKMFPDANKLEIFARRVKPGWTCIGNEVCAGEDIRVSIDKL